MAPFLRLAVTAAAGFLPANLSSADAKDDTMEHL
jgi:hypothetical protein